jgi:hypothetical protein
MKKESVKFIKKRERKPETVLELFNALETAWYNIDTSVINNLMDSTLYVCNMRVRNQVERDTN